MFRSLFRGWKIEELAVLFTSAVIIGFYLGIMLGLIFSDWL